MGVGWIDDCYSLGLWDGLLVVVGVVIVSNCG